MRASKRNQEDDPAAEKGPRGERVRRLAGAVREGGRETRGRLEGRPAEGLARVGAALAAFARLAAEMLRGLWHLLGEAAGALARGPLAGVGRRVGGGVATLSRLLTPARVLVAVAIGCAVLLALSQFADYRGVAVGTDNYAGVESVAPAPEVDRQETGSAHSYLFVPGAVLAILLLAAAARTRRWQLCRLAALIGIAAIVVAIVVDRPAGLDEGELARQFAGVEATLLGGYWMQIFAGAGLAVTSLLAGSELRRMRPGEARASRRPRPGAASSRSGPAAPPGPRGSAPREAGA
jgi:hypothetical protein